MRGGSSTLSQFKGPCMLTQRSVLSQNPLSLIKESVLLPNIELFLTSCEKLATSAKLLFIALLDILLSWSKSTSKWKQKQVLRANVSPSLKSWRRFRTNSASPHFKPLCFHWLLHTLWSSWVWLTTFGCHCFIHCSKTFLTVAFMLLLNMEVIFISLDVAVHVAHMNFLCVSSKLMRFQCLAFHFLLLQCLCSTVLLSLSWLITVVLLFVLPERFFI